VRPGRRTLASAILAFLLVTASGVFAHECYNASASPQGNLMKAANWNGNWTLALDVREVIATGSSGFVSGLPILNACQQTVFLASWQTTGFPLVFTVGGGNNQANGQGNTIAENNPNMATGLGSNNQGIDHFGDTGPALFAAVNTAYGAAFAAACSRPL
jgi:hypothetical protein